MKSKFILNCHEGRDTRDWEMPKIKADTRTGSFSRRNLTPPVVNQGSVGSCVGQSGRVVFGDTPLNRMASLSAMWIYKTAKQYDVWDGEDYEGTSVSGACKALRAEGVCTERYWPYVNTEDTVAKPGAAQDAMHRKIHAYYAISFDRPEEVKTLINNESLWFSISVNSNFFYVGETGIVNESDYLDSEYAGGHAMSIIGWKYIDGQLYWEIQNSWGTDWGDSGYCFIPHSLMVQIQLGKCYYLVTVAEHQKDLDDLIEDEEIVIDEEEEDSKPDDKKSIFQIFYDWLKKTFPLLFK